MDAMQAIRETFFQECEEQLGELETGLLAVEAGDTDSETINAVFRAVHSIKGGAGAFKLDKLVRFAHGFETTLDNIRNNVLAPAPHVLKVMLRAADVLADLVRDAREGTDSDETRAKELLKELQALDSQQPAVVASEPAPEEQEVDPFAALGFEPLTLDFEEEPSLQSRSKIHGSNIRLIFVPSPPFITKGTRQRVCFVNCSVWASWRWSAIPPRSRCSPIWTRRPLISPGGQR